MAVHKWKKRHIKQAPHDRRIDDADVQVLSATRDEEINEGLRAIYGEETDDLHTVERGESRVTAFLVRLVGFLAFLTVVVVGGFFAYYRFSGTSAPESALELTILAEGEVRSGEEVSITVTYRNVTETPLADLTLDLNLPPGFVLSTSSLLPTDTQELIYRIGALGRKSDAQIVLTGVWQASVPSEGLVQAVATYRPGNFNSDFSKISSVVIRTLSSTVQLTAEGPAQSTPGSEAVYIYHVEQVGAEPSVPLELHVSLPEGYFVTGTDPVIPTGQAVVFSVPALNPGEKMTYMVAGSYGSDVEDIQKVQGSLILPLVSGDLLQGELAYFTDVRGSDLRMTLVANGSSTKASITPGGILRLSLRLENVGDEPYTDTSLLLDFQPGSGIPLIWKDGVYDVGKVTAAGILFDAQTIGTLAPGMRKSFNISIPVKADLLPNDLTEFTVFAAADTSGVRVQTAPLTLAVNANASLAAEARYYADDGSVVGNGVFPPRVGEETGYEMSFVLNYSPHALTDIVVSAPLAPGVAYAGGWSADSGEVSYDETNRIVRWTVSKTAQSSGTLRAKFKVTTISQAIDEGKYMKLLGVATLNAVDGVTDALVESLGEAVTTELLVDTVADGRGVIQGE